MRASSSKSTKIISVIGLFLLVLSSPLLSAQEASTPAAQEDEESVLISLRPKDAPDGSRFEVTVEPGESVELVAVLQNFGSEPIELRTYVAGLIPVPNGGIRVADSESERTGTALWLDYETEELLLQPGELVERTIAVSVPSDADPGEYVNGVALETVKPVNEGQGGSIEQYFRKAVSIYITVPGSKLLKDFALGEPEVRVVANQAIMYLPISNTGNQRIDVYGTVVVTDSTGGIILQQDVALNPIYNGQVTNIRVVFPALPTSGDYSLTYTFTEFNSEISVSAEELTLVVPEATAMDQEPMSFENVMVEANSDPIVFANVSVEIAMYRPAAISHRLTLSVLHNGDLVEEFVLAENLTLPQGTTVVSQRYLPNTNWAPGTYTFSLKLESTDGGTTSLLLEEEDVATLEVP